MSPNPKPRFFATPGKFRIWLERNHVSGGELWVGFYKKASGRASITWPESVDQALCFGWIDGLRKSVDSRSYMIRFTPRRPGSIWSAINIRRAEELARGGSMHARGHQAFAARIENKSGIYAYEQRSVNLPARYARLMKANKAAWTDFRKRAPSYRKAVNWWIVSAKTEATRLKRLHRLIECCAEGREIP